MVVSLCGVRWKCVQQGVKIGKAITVSHSVNIGSCDAALGSIFDVSVDGRGSRL